MIKSGCRQEGRKEGIIDERRGRMDIWVYIRMRKGREWGRREIGDWEKGSERSQIAREARRIRVKMREAS